MILPLKMVGSKVKLSIFTLATEKKFGGSMLATLLGTVIGLIGTAIIVKKFALKPVPVKKSPKR